MNRGNSILWHSPLSILNINVINGSFNKFECLHINQSPFEEFINQNDIVYLKILI